ncbi:serine hydrolase domain-containing protein [Natronospirillum operosum]|nr:serine hydrolase domain-containing protein [Natronospirillum operosum]
MTLSLDALLDELIERKDVHSAVMSVTSGDGSFQWAGARGVMSPGGPPVTETTPWFIASITKLFIAATVLRLVENGELALQDRLVDRLDTALTHRLHVLDGQDHTDQITLKHLLGHASGLPDFIEDYPKQGPDRRSLVETLLAEGDRAWTLAETTHWVRERLTPHFVPQPLSDPRARIRYSDTNYQLLIGIIETCRGAPFFQVLDELILRPLSLNNTWLSGRYPSSPNNREAEPQVPALYAGADVVQLPNFLADIGDLNSTCDDLTRFLKGLVNGGLFQNPDTWHQMQAHARTFSFPRDRAALRQPGWPIQYGLGVMRFQLPRLFTPFRPMPRVEGHTGSTGTWLFHAPKLDLYLTGAVNQVTAGAVPFKVVPRILKVFNATLAKSGHGG